MDFSRSQQLQQINFSSFLCTFVLLLGRTQSKLCEVTDTSRLCCLRVAKIPDLSGPTIGTQEPPPSPARMSSKLDLDQEKSLEAMAEQAEAGSEVEKTVPAEPADEPRGPCGLNMVCIFCVHRQHANNVRLT
jgi:hypothetical protein